MDGPQNPIVALAQRIRAQKEVDSAIDAGGQKSLEATGAEALLRAFGDELQAGAKRLASITGPRSLTFIRLENPLRVRLRFRGRDGAEMPERRIRLSLDAARELVIVAGLDLDGEYQFDSGAAVPSLINLSKLSTDEGYGEAITASSLLKTIATGAELPRPAHLDSPGPLQF